MAMTPPPQKFLTGLSAQVVIERTQGFNELANAFGEGGCALNLCRPGWSECRWGFVVVGTNQNSWAGRAGHDRKA
jgi:hypothetical protein